MKKWRFSSIAGTAAIVALAVSGCSSTPTVPDSEDTGAGIVRVLSIPLYETAMTSAAEEFERLNPGIKIDLTFAETGALQTALRTQLSAGTAPDVFSTWPGKGSVASMGELAPGGYLADLSSLPFSKNIPSGADVVTTFDGKRLVLPMSMGAIGAFYNERAVAEINAKVPTKWSEVLKYCDAAKAGGKVAFAYGAQTGWNNQLFNYALTPTLVYANSQSFDVDMASGKASFADSGWKIALEKQIEMLDRGCFQEAPLGTSYEVAVEMVARGEALSIVSVSSTFGALRAAAEDSVTFGFFGLPANENSESTWIAAGGSGGYGVNAAAKNKIGAMKFIAFLGLDKSMADFADLSGSLPLIMSDSFVLTSATREMFKYVEAGKIYPYMDQLWTSPKVGDAHKTGVQQLLGGEATPTEVLTAMDKAYKGNG